MENPKLKLDAPLQNKLIVEGQQGHLARFIIPTKYNIIKHKLHNAKENQSLNNSLTALNGSRKILTFFS